MMTDTGIPTVLNPLLSPELRTEVEFFQKWGYLVVENATTTEQVEVLRQAIDLAYQEAQSQFIGDLLEQDDRFLFLLDNPPVLQRIKAILGNCIQLHSATSRVTKPGEDDQNWHRDGPWPVDPNGTPYGSLPGQINCGYFLDELTMANGPIVIVPGSQRALFRPPEGYPKFPDEKYVMAKPGQAVLFDGWLFHRGAANHSDQRRRVCLMCYQNAWMKSREPIRGPRASKLLAEGTDEQRLLLGRITKW